MKLLHIAFVSSFLIVCCDTSHLMENNEGRPAILSLSDSLVFRILLDSKNTLYAATAAGIIYSADTGQNWYRTPFTSGLVNSMIVDSVGTVYVATDDNGVFGSRDGGATWSEAGLQNREINALVLNHAGQLLAGSGQSGLFVGLHSADSLVWFESRTFDGSEIEVIALFADSVMYVDTDLGLYRTSDGGASWEERGTHPETTKDLEILSSFEIVAANEFGIVYSTDAGDSWSFPFPFGRREYGLALHLSLSRILYGSMNDSLFKSIDSGQSWEAVAAFDSDITDILTDTDNRIFVASRGSGVFLSTDEGLSWQSIMK